MGFWPPTIPEQLNFGQVHISPWSSNAVAIGITAADAADFQALVDTAILAYNEAEQARLDSKQKTQALRQALDAMHDKASFVVSAVNAKAKQTNNPGVYTLAALPVPGTGGGGTTPPTMPSDVRAFLANDGSVLVEWKGIKKDTAFYSVWRSLSAGGTFIQVGSTDEKSYVDSSIPNGSSTATYYVKAHKGQLESSASEPVVVIFGCGLSQAA